MPTISIRFTTERDVARWEKLEVAGKLGPRQRERLEEWRRANGRPYANRVGEAILSAARGEPADGAGGAEDALRKDADAYQQFAQATIEALQAEADALRRQLADAQAEIKRASGFLGLIRSKMREIEELGYQEADNSLAGVLAAKAGTAIDWIEEAMPTAASDAL
jgi:hypothetical protein